MGIAAVAAVAGCATVGAGRGVDPASVEIELAPWKKEGGREQTALFFAAHVNGPFTGKLEEVALEKNGVAVASAKLPSFWLSAGPRDTQRVGAGLLGDRGRMYFRANPDLVLAGVEPGRYDLVLRLRANGAKKSSTSRVPVDVIRLPSTSGYQLAVSPASHIRHAAIRLSDKPIYGERTRPPEDQFWMTVPVDIRQPRSRVDTFWYYRGKLRGWFTRDLSPGPVAAGQPYKVPVRMWGWPENLPMASVLGGVGDWQVHVIQDGEYLTTCHFAVGGGRIRGAGVNMHVLPCAPDRSDATAEVRRRAAYIRGYHRDEGREREVMALRRGKKARGATSASPRASSPPASSPPPAPDRRVPSRQARRPSLPNSSS
jgi:hypothetical protein